MPSVSWYQQAFVGSWQSRDFDWLADTIKCALLADTYTPDLDLHDAWDDVSGHEITGTGYAAGGEALTSKTVDHDTANNVVRLAAGNVLWATATFTARYGVVYDDSPAAAADKVLLGLVDFDSNQSPAGENFTIVWDATDKILRVTVA